MAGPGPKGTRVDGSAGGGKSVDKRSNAERTPSDVPTATNAKIPVDGVENVGVRSISGAKPATRPTTSGR